MDALILFRGFLNTTWLVYWILKTPFFLTDLAYYWIPTAPLPLFYFWLFFGSSHKMNKHKCCVRKCNKTRADHTILHCFPNPDKDLERFVHWTNAIGGDMLFLDKYIVYKEYRICHSHFEEKYHTRSKRLSANAVPTLLLPGMYSFRRQPMQEITNQNSRGLQGQEVPSTQPIASTSTQPVPSESNQPSVTEQPMASTSYGMYSFRGQPMQEITNQNSRGLQGQEVPSTQPIASTSTQPVPSESNQPSVTEQPMASTSYGHRKKSFVSAEVTALGNKIKRLQKAKGSVMEKLKKALKLSENKTFQKALQKFSAAATIFIMLQFREIHKNKLGRRFTKKEKLMSLALYKQGPKAYRWLRKLLVLPSPLTLSRMITRASLKTGVNDNLFKQLKKRIRKMNSTERLCILLFDEIALTPHLDYSKRRDEICGFVDNGLTKKAEIADHALVFMVRGIQRNYKQPLAYTFCKGTTSKFDLTEQIKNMIRQLNKIGFKVLATVCDQGATNTSAINCMIEETRQDRIKRGEESKNKTFEVDGEEVIPLFDTPHLMKGIRNNLLVKNLTCVINGKLKTAKWDHIVKLYNEDPGYQGIRLLPKLTDKHVIPNKIAKMKVKCATQIFSSSVAGTMGYLANHGIIPKESEETADILIFFDKLFDSLNGSFENSKKRRGKPLLGPVTPSSIHKQLWRESKKVLGSMRFVNKNKKSASVPTLRNWLLTIENMEYTVDVLTKKYNLTSLWLRHFNQDPLENFFGSIRSHGYRNNSPTCAGFEAAFAALLINNISSVHSPGSNCEVDKCTVFTGLGKLFFTEPEVSNYTVDVDFGDIDSDHIFININDKMKFPKIRAQLEYVSGYVLKKLNIKKCADCKECMFACDQEYSTVEIREFWKNKRCLTYPSMNIIKCFSNIQDVVTNILRRDPVKKHIKIYIKTVFSVVMDYSFIKCQQHKSDIIKGIEEVSTNIFIYTWCKETNKILSGLRTDFDVLSFVQVLAYEYYKKRCKNKIKSK